MRSPVMKPPGPARPQASSLEPQERQRLLAQAAHLQDKARGLAEAGDIANAAQCILQALDCERRSGGLGPQVLQLIKPR